MLIFRGLDQKPYIPRSFSDSAIQIFFIILDETLMNLTDKQIALEGYRIVDLRRELVN